MLHSACQTQCDNLVDTVDRHSSYTNTEVDFEKTTVDGQLQELTEFTKTQQSELTTHREDMERYIKQELSECVPTGW